jgi:two-component system heavy metal sensor histidine kinase CusS
MATAALLESRQKAEADRIVRQALHLVQEVRSPGDEATLLHKLDDLMVGHGELHLKLVRADGSTVFQSSAWAVRERGDELGVDAHGEAPLSKLGRVDVAVRLERARSSRILDVLAAALAVAALLGALSLAWIGARLVRQGFAPIDDLALRLGTWTATTARADPGEAASIEELRPFIERLDAMLDEVRFAHQQLRSFNEDVAHELRTPLAVLIGDTEVTLAHSEDAPALADTLTRNLDELRRLGDIVADMLFLARADSSGVASRASVASMAAIVHAVVEYFDAALAERGLQVGVHGDAHGTFDAALLRRAVSNLLANALRYANAGTSIEIRIEPDPAEPARVCVSVSNEGPGIAAADLPRIFDRFYRADASRERTGRHYGLGLAIVAAIARMHAGCVHARSAAGVTTVVFCVLGSANPSHPGTNSIHLATKDTVS